MVRILGRANSINVQKVMWLAAEIGLDIERFDVGGAFGGNDTPEYLAKNPSGKIPTMEDGDFVLWESNSIVRYLAEKYGSSPWYPALVEDRYSASQWMDHYIATHHPSMTTIFYNLIRMTPEERDDKVVAKCVETLSGAWAVVDRHLAENEFLTGTAPTMGDVPMGCAAYRWHTLDIERPDLPHLRRWYEALASRSAFKEHVMLPLT